MEAECPGYWAVGTCGDFLYVWHRWGYGDHFVKYFDASGALIAAEVWADYTAYCDGSFFIFYGPVPDCQREATLVCGLGGTDGDGGGMGSFKMEP
jgi:hypothetical protein